MLPEIHDSCERKTHVLVNFFLQKKKESGSIFRLQVLQRKPAARI